MKTCHACGTQVDDKELVCPVCGATVVMSTSGSGLSLKEDNKQKLKSSPSMGQTVSTGSGLTNILKRDDDFDDLEDNNTYVMGSIPTSLSKNNMYDDSRADAEYRRRRENKKVISTIIKLIVLAAIIYGVYFVVVNYILVEKGAKTYEDAVAIYVEAVNNQDVDKMKEIVAPYYSNPTDMAEEYVNAMSKAHITSSDIASVSEISSAEINLISQNVQLEYNKTAYITSAYTVTVEMKGTVTDKSGNMINKGHKVKMDFLQMDGKWYFYSDTYDNPTFTE